MGQNMSNGSKYIKCFNGKICKIWSKCALTKGQNVSKLAKTYQIGWKLVNMGIN